MNLFTALGYKWPICSSSGIQHWFLCRCPYFCAPEQQFSFYILDKKELIVFLEGGALSVQAAHVIICLHWIASVQFVHFNNWKWKNGRCLYRQYVRCCFYTNIPGNTFGFKLWGSIYFLLNPYGSRMIGNLDIFRVFLSEIFLFIKVTCDLEFIKSDFHWVSHSLSLLICKWINITSYPVVFELFKNFVGLKNAFFTRCTELLEWFMHSSSAYRDFFCTSFENWKYC